MIMMRRLVLAWLVLWYVLWWYVSAQSNLPDYKANSFQVVWEVDKSVISTTYDELTSSSNNKSFWEAYNKKAESFWSSTNEWLAKQMATGVMNWDTIIAYSASIITFISNLWLVAGAWFIIVSWYQYAMSIFGSKPDKWAAIKNAFIGIAVISMSYGLFRLLANVFIE